MPLSLVSLSISLSFIDYECLFSFALYYLSLPSLYFTLFSKSFDWYILKVQVFLETLVLLKEVFQLSFLTAYQTYNPHQRCLISYLNVLSLPLHNLCHYLSSIYSHCNPIYYLSCLIFQKH